MLVTSTAFDTRVCTKWGNKTYSSTSAVFPVHAAGCDHIMPPLLYSIWSLLRIGERRWLPTVWPTNVCCHHSHIFDPRKCSGKRALEKVSLLIRYLDAFMIHSSLPRLGSINTIGQLSITSSYGEASRCTLPFYLQCIAMAYLAFVKVISPL